MKIADKLIMYELHVDGQRDEPQPRVVVLESKLLKHHLLHWNWPGPPAPVTFQVRQSCAGQCCVYNNTMIAGIYKIRSEIRCTTN